MEFFACIVKVESLLEGRKQKTKKIKIEGRNQVSEGQRNMPTNTLHRASPCQDFGTQSLEKKKKQKPPFATCFKKFHNLLKMYNEVACNVKADKQLQNGKQGSSVLHCNILSWNRSKY